MKPKFKSSSTVVIPAAQVRESFGTLLEEVHKNGKSYVVQKRGEPRAIVLSISDYIRLAAPEPEVLKILGESSKKRGTNRLTPKQIDQAIKETRKSSAAFSSRT